MERTTTGQPVPSTPVVHELTFVGNQTGCSCGRWLTSVSSLKRKQELHARHAAEQERA